MNVIDAITDADMGFVSFTVSRITYSKSRSGDTSSTETIQAEGCIHPGTPDALQLLPEEERTNEFIVIYSLTELSTGNANTSATAFTGADRVLWNGDNWRVVKVKDWHSFGYYYALAVKMNEEMAES